MADFTLDQFGFRRPNPDYSKMAGYRQVSNPNYNPASRSGTVPASSWQFSGSAYDTDVGAKPWQAPTLQNGMFRTQADLDSWKGALRPSGVPTMAPDNYGFRQNPLANTQTLKNQNAAFQWGVEQGLIEKPNSSSSLFSWSNIKENILPIAAIMAPAVMGLFGAGAAAAGGGGTSAGMGYGAGSGLTAAPSATGAGYGWGTLAAESATPAAAGTAGLSVAPSAGYSSLIAPTATAAGAGAASLAAPSAGLGAAGAGGAGAAGGSLSLENIGQAAKDLVTTPKGLAEIGKGVYGLYSANKAKAAYEDLASQIEAGFKQSDPFASFRPEALEMLRELEANPEAYLQSPEVQAARNRAIQLIERQAASQGKRLSGNLLQDLMDFSSQYDYEALQRRRGELAGWAGASMFPNPSFQQVAAANLGNLQGARDTRDRTIGYMIDLALDRMPKIGMSDIKTFGA